MLRMLSNVCEERFSIVDLAKIVDVKKLFDVVHECVFSELVNRGQGKLHLVQLQTMTDRTQFSDLSVRESKGCLETRYGIREISLGCKFLYAVLTTNENFLILDLTFQDISATIRRNAYPRIAKLSPCERFIIASFSDNTVFIYSTASGQPLEKILGIPRGASSFVLSGNSNRLFFANNHTVCLWSVPRGQLELGSAQWKNINCYTIDHEGKQLALGTYSGTIVLLTLITMTKVTEVELKRHKSCVMVICFSKNQIFSVSYDKIMLITTIGLTNTNEKAITYTELQLDSVPRSIVGICGLPHLLENQGLFWIVEGNKMRGYSEGLYGVNECEGIVYIMRYSAGKLQCFRR